jgi:predicted GNAT superfamily acetyltransferase
MWIGRFANRLFNPLMPDFRHASGHNVENFSTWIREDVNRWMPASRIVCGVAWRGADASRGAHR